MGDDNIIKVRIEKTITVNETESSPAQAITTTTEQSQNIDKLAKTAKSGRNLAASMAAQYGKQIIGFAVSNYGELTGDYSGQRKIGEAVEIGGLIASVAASPILGGIAVGVTAASKIGEYHIQKAKHDMQVSQLRERTQTSIY